ncbi:hypothetical protein HanPI659440_Chr15g0583781 [Helianthus annuus]|nr:hypothetical protein HanPI659440_Chr15g0583781 [Helianthus annuus]
MTDLSGLSFVYAFPFFVQSPTDLPNSRDPSLFDLITTIIIIGFHGCKTFGNPI